MDWISIGDTARALLEIFILAVGFYSAFVLLRGTRGAAVLAGFLGLMLLLTGMTAVLHLEVFGWLLRNFSGFLVVATMVLFQPELRLILAELGQRPLQGIVRQQRQNIEIIIQAANRLSEMRIGALIALEQSIMVQEAVESGLMVDCEATPEMLETIFFPNNAIHDGGVIIKGDRITFAACIFPLTQRQDLNPSLGTRHRAAIGLSEETDAIVIVVSEETGSIGYAFKGQLVRGITEEELRAFLSSIMLKPSHSHKSLVWLRRWWYQFRKPNVSKT